MLREEFKLIVVLVLHGAAFSPALFLASITLSTPLLALYMLAVLTSVALASSSICRDRFQLTQARIQWLAWIYSLFHMNLFGLGCFTLYRFLVPFMTMASFQENCLGLTYLRENASGYDCQHLQPIVAVSLVLVTGSMSLQMYLIVLGKRIARKQDIEYARVKKEMERHATPSPSADSLLHQV